MKKIFSSKKIFQNQKKEKRGLWRHPIKPLKGSTIYMGRMLPNMITFLALCMGLTSVHFAFLLQWEKAVASVLIAGVLDGMDGRLARFMGNSTHFGAELDSLSDFINFGVSPSLLVFFFSLHQWNEVGWGLSLFFSACMALRLARFNTQRLEKSERHELRSVGLPAPAAAFLLLFPVIITFVFHCAVSPWVFAPVTLGVSALMVSRFPTFLINKYVVPSYYRVPMVLILLMTVIGMLTAPWETLLGLGVFYLFSLPVSGYLFYKKKISSNSIT